MKSAVHARPLQICLLIFKDLTDPCATHARYLFQSYSDMYSFKNENKTLRMNPGWVSPRGGVGGGGGWAVLGSGFAGYVPLASQNPHPIIVYSIANYRPHFSHFWANVIVISRTEFNASRMLNIKTTAETIFQPRIFLFLNPAYQNFLVPKIPKICEPILVALLKM